MSGYQHIREQLVGLNVDLDDKRKICAHLEEKIVGERAKLSRVETELNVRYEDAMENEFGDRQKEMTRLKGLSDQLVNEKKEHVKICQVLMEMVTGEESDVAAEHMRRKHVVLGETPDEAEEALLLMLRHAKQLTLHSTTIGNCVGHV